MSSGIVPDWKTDETAFRAKRFAEDVQKEYFRARKLFGPFGNGHEGLAVILEEFEELKKFVFSKNQTLKEIEEARKECLQLAAMSLAFSIELLEQPPLEQFYVGGRIEIKIPLKNEVREHDVNSATWGE